MIKNIYTYEMYILLCSICKIHNLLFYSENSFFKLKDHYILRMLYQNELWGMNSRNVWVHWLVLDKNAFDL